MLTSRGQNPLHQRLRGGSNITAVCKTVQSHLSLRYTLPVAETLSSPRNLVFSKNPIFFTAKAMIQSTNREPHAMCPPHPPTPKPRVPDQNGVSQAWYIVEMHHSGWEPLIYSFSLPSTLTSLIR